MNDFSLSFFVGVCVGGLLMALIAIVTFTPEEVWERQAIKRGYALYCPQDGKFAWAGECKEKESQQ